jgi:hypothetical protein
VPTRVVAEIFSRADDFLLGSGKCSGGKSFAFGKGTLDFCLLYVRADEVAQSGHAKEDIESDSFCAWPVFSCTLAPGSSLKAQFTKNLAQLFSSGQDRITLGLL